MRKIITIIITSVIVISCNSNKTKSDINIVGEMKNVMWKGQLQGTINLDTIANKEHLYGFGPVEYLAGELLIIDGKSYQSTVVNDSVMKVEENFKVKAPFFAYANIDKWKEEKLPDSIQTMKQLEDYLTISTKKIKQPFMFKLKGVVDSASIHIVNLPKGSKVTSPEQAHKGQINYIIKNEPSEVIGFFSTEHKAIFTHHDTFLHMHLITQDKSKMGHIDALTFKKNNMKLYIAAM